MISTEAIRRQLDEALPARKGKRQGMPKYRLQIKSGGPAPSPYSWELCRAGEEYPREKSRETFRTALLAKMAGNNVLRELEHQEGGAPKKAKR